MVGSSSPSFSWKFLSVLPPCLQAASLYQHPWVPCRGHGRFPRPLPPTLFQDPLSVLNGGALKGLGLTWSMSRAHTQSHGHARQAELSRIVRLGGFLAFSKGDGHYVFKRTLRTIPAFEWKNSWQRCMHHGMGVAKFTISLNVFLRLFFVDVWDVRLRLGMMKFRPEYIGSLL